MTVTAKYLSELIALPSVNPAFLPVNDLRAGERRMADFLAATASRAGVDVEFQAVSPKRSNLLVRLSPAQKAQQRILLAPHLDTVGGPGLRESCFRPTIKKSRLFGRGACDTKGSVAAMMAALCELASGKHRPRRTEIIFAGLVDEECGQTGSRKLAASGFKADLAIVGEPTCLKVVTAHKGALWLRMQTRGKAAHGARPELGRNAVHEMARIVYLLETGYAEQLQKKQHPLLRHATINVGSIEGGKQPNIVPDECSALIDRRTLPGESNSRVLAEINTLLRRNNLSARIRSIQSGACGPMEIDASHPLVQKLFQAAGQKAPAGVDYFSDAGVQAAAGIPSVLFGPGDIAQAHTQNEWISMAELEQAKELLLRFFRALS